MLHYESLIQKGIVGFVELVSHSRSSQSDKALGSVNTRRVPKQLRNPFGVVAYVGIVTQGSA